MLYTNCVAYMLKYLQRIFGANQAIWSVCWRERGKEKYNVKYLSQHPFKCNLSEGK